MSFVRAFAAMTGASATSLVAQLIRGKIAALFLGPAGVGIFNQLSLAWNLVNVAGGLGTFIGVTQHGAEALGRDDQLALQRLSSTFTVLLGATSLMFALLGAIYAEPLSDWLLHDEGEHAPLLALLMLAAPIGVTAQLWRALLSAGQHVRALVHAQIASDLIGAGIFVLMVVWQGLAGAVAGFLASHFLLFLIQAWYIRRRLGPGMLRPRLARFDWALVRSNVGFGASGLLLTVLANLGVLLVSQLLIGRLGPEANAYFANAWRIASVYLGAVTATTFAYILPSLTRAPDNAAMGREVNETLRFYLSVLPLVLAGIMAFGEWVVWLILSNEFAPVAGLLLLMVPAELARIGVDTLLAPHVARRRLVSLTVTYLLQCGAFLGLAWLLVPSFGVSGAALAYAGAMSGSLLFSLVICRVQFGFRLEGSTVRLGLMAAALLVAVGSAASIYSIALTRFGICALACVVWLLLALREDEPRRLLGGAVLRLTGRV